MVRTIRCQADFSAAYPDADSNMPLKIGHRALPTPEPDVRLDMHPANNIGVGLCDRYSRAVGRSAVAADSNAANRRAGVVSSP
jgi:hypothetical protein